jgi:hypothetical protein
MKETIVIAILVVVLVALVWVLKWWFTSSTYPILIG